MIHGEVIEGDTAGYQYYPGRDQALEWLSAAGFRVAHEETGPPQGWGYRHFILATSWGPVGLTTDGTVIASLQARPRIMSMSRPRTRSPSARSPLCSNSSVVQMRMPLIAAAVSSAKARSTYRSFT